MRNRKIFVLSLVLFLISPFITCKINAQDASKIDIKTTRLSDTVYLLQGIQDGSTVGGNIAASIGPDGILLVDSQYLVLSDKIRDALRKITGTEPKIKFIINTHWHRDHSEGNKELGKDATIIAQKNVYQRLSTPQTLFNRKIDPYPANALPIITFNDSLSLNFNGEEIRVVHLPNSHTDGDSIVLFTKSKVLHTGDIYTGPVFPFVDFDHGGNVESLEKGVQNILSMIAADAKIVPGHRAVTDMEGLKTYDRMLSDSLKTVRQSMAGGKTLKEIQDGLASEWKNWEWQALKMPQWMEYVYRSISK